MACSDPSPLPNLCLFPSELMDAICRHLPVADLKATRLTCRTLGASATVALFHTLRCTADTHTIRRLQTVARHGHLSRIPRAVVIDLTLSHLLLDQCNRGLLAFFVRSATNTQSLPNLTSIALILSPKKPKSKTEGQQGLDVTGRQRKMALQYFDAILGIIHPHLVGEAIAFRSLRIYNLSLVDHEGPHTERLRHLLGGLQSLQLQLAVEPAGDRGLSAVSKEQQSIGHRLAQHWLFPAAFTLRSLVIVQKGHWGLMYSEDDFKELTFPNLQELVLARYAISFDSQIDLIANQKSLESLCLVDCAIVPLLRFDAAQADEIGMRQEKWQRFETASSRTFWTQFVYRTRWHHIFQRLSYDLPRLRKFEFQCLHSGVRSQRRCLADGMRYHRDLSLDEHLRSDIETGLNPCHYTSYEIRGKSQKWTTMGQDARRYTEPDQIHKMNFAIEMNDTRTKNRLCLKALLDAAAARRTKG